MERVRLVGLVMAVLRALAIAVALGLLLGFVPLWRAAGSIPAIDVHTVPWSTHAGRITFRHPPGQGFRCDAPGLSRIDVALVRLGRVEDDGVLLRLREGGPEGPAVREVLARPGELPGSGELVPFHFDPLPDSEGRDYFFELLPGGAQRPSDFSPFVRYRGQVGHNGAWGSRIYGGPLVEGLLRQARARDLPTPYDLYIPAEVPHPWLRAVSFGVIGVAPRLGEVRLELREEGADGPPLREATLAPWDERRGGFVFFTFEPIEESRFRRYTYRLFLHEGATLVGDAWGPTLKTWHGLGGGDARLAGMTSAGELYPDRDLVFRAYTRRDPAAALLLALERGGWRLPAGLSLWLTSTALLVHLALRRRSNALSTVP